jgi:cyclophilin family peptidyl-prolyl cis-trans isomerase
LYYNVSVIRLILRLLVIGVVAVAASAQTDAEVEAVVTTSLGAFRFEFFPDKAPQHVEQFIRLAREGYYDGSAFHLAYLNGAIQGGDPLLKEPDTPRELWGSGGLKMLSEEISDVKHDRGVVSTIRIPDVPDSDGAQFFVCLAPQPALDGEYSAFGLVNEGIEVVQEISQQPLAEDGKLVEPVRILTITIEPKKQEPFLSATPDEMRRTVTLQTTLGSMKLQMVPDWAPENVRNFLKLVATGWLNGTEFHRIAKGFVVQGGTGYTRSSGPTHSADRWVRPVKAELRADVQHVRGIVSMAHGDDPDSATTSFFIVLGDSPALDNQYSAFARVVEGIEVLDAFEMEEVEGEKPKRRLEVVEASID